MIHMQPSAPLPIPRGPPAQFSFGGPTSPPPSSSASRFKHSRSVSSTQHGTGAMSWTEIAFDFMSRSPLNSSLHQAMGSPQYTSFVGSPGSFGDHDRIPTFERDFFKDFVCCGRDLGDLHDLLTHFEEAHVLVTDVDGQLVILPNDVEMSSSPNSIDSPLGPTTPPLFAEGDVNQIHPLHHKLKQHALQYIISQVHQRTNPMSLLDPQDFNLKTPPQAIEADLSKAFSNGYVGKAVGFAHAYGFPQLPASPPQSAFAPAVPIHPQVVEPADATMHIIPSYEEAGTPSHSQQSSQHEEQDVMMDFDPLDVEAEAPIPALTPSTLQPSAPPPICASPSLLMSPPMSIGSGQSSLCVSPSLISGPSLIRSRSKNSKSSSSRPHSRAATPTPGHSPNGSTLTSPVSDSPPYTISNPHTTLLSSQGVEQARAAALAELSRPTSTSPSRAARAKTRLVYSTSSTTTGSGSEVEGTVVVSRKREKAHKCPVPGCTKSYLNPNGLKYHLSKGTCAFDTTDAPIVHSAHNTPQLVVVSP